MPLTYQPPAGVVVYCDFSGFVQPEMVKTRPVVVLARNKKNNKLVTVVPISSTEPDTLQAYHHELLPNPIPDKPGVRSWAKCDMLTTVFIARLDRVKQKLPNGKRTYLTPAISRSDFQAIQQCVVNALNLGLIKKP